MYNDNETQAGTRSSTPVTVVPGLCHQDHNVHLKIDVNQSEHSIWMDPIVHQDCEHSRSKMMMLPRYSPLVDQGRWSEVS